MELLSTHDKLKTLLHELLTAKIWKSEIFPKIKKTAKPGIRSYLSIFHEGVVLNLLEIVCYYKTALEALGENLVDLMDYVYEKLSLLAGGEDLKRFFGEEEDFGFFEGNLGRVEFEVRMSCLSILRYVSDHLKVLPVSVRSFLMNEKDVLMVLVKILENKPWVFKDGKGVVRKWENRKFVKKEGYGVCKEEGQIWLTIYNLIFQEDCAKNYEINDFRKNNLLRLKKYLTDVLLDQIPVLSSLQRTLEEMSIMKVKTNFVSNPFVVQTVPQMKKKILKHNIPEIIEKHRILFSQEFQKENSEILNQMTDTYSHSIIVNEEKFKCGNCGENATKKCSRCKSIFYCSFDCQKTHYKSTHKKVCKKIAIEKGLIKEDHLVLKGSKKIKRKVEERKVEEKKVEVKKIDVKVAIDYEELC